MAPEDSDNISGINTPGITYPEGKITRKAVKDAAQVYAIAKNLENANRTRDTKNAQIARRYNGEAPFDPTRMKASGQNHRCNFSPRFMATVIDRKIPEFVAVIENGQTLTNSELPIGWPDKSDKERKFRKRITETIRSWAEWRDYLNRLSAENTIYGYACTAFTDTYNWRPEIFTQSNFYVPDDCYQYAKSCQVLILKKPFLISEAIEKIADANAAELAGWNIKNWVDAINNAYPKQLSSGTQNSQQKEWVDQQREGNLYESMQSGTKFIQTYDCYFQEADGTVTQYMVNLKDGKELFCQENRYKSMADVCAFMTLEVGNGKLHGSNGLGKRLYNITVAAERSLCMFVDAANIGSFKVLQMAAADVAKMNQVKLTVAQPFVIVATDATLQGTVDLSPDPTLFTALYSQLTNLAQIVAAAVLPGNTGPQGPDITATEATINAQREEQVKASQLARWAYQLSNVISTVQKRLCDPETVDEVALAMQEQLLTEDGLTAEEVQKLANCPPARSLSDIEAVERQKISEVVAKYGPTPFVDQLKLASMDIKNMVGDDLAEEILMTPQNEQANQIEQARQQMTEAATMVSSQADVPVSPRDNHKIHRAVIKEAVNKIAQALPVNPDPILINGSGTLLRHFQAHIDKELEGGAKKEDVAEDQQWLQDTNQQIILLAQKAKQLIAETPVN